MGLYQWALVGGFAIGIISVMIYYVSMWLLINMSYYVI